MRLAAAETLAKAHYFLVRARDTATNESWIVATNLEAAIVFARSVTFHLQKQFAALPAFEGWYQLQQERLMKSPISAFLLEQRNHALKVGAVPVQRTIHVEMSDYVGVTDHDSRDPAEKQRSGESVVRHDAIYFVETEWKDTPAIELVAQHLNVLGEIVDDASRVFADILGDAA